MIIKQYISKFNQQLLDVVNFEQLGFQVFENDKFFYGWKLKKYINDKTDIISYGFSKDKRGYDVFLHPIRSFIVFEAVNKILLNINNQSYNFYLNDPTIIQIPGFDKKDTEYYDNISKLSFVCDRVILEEIYKEALELFKEQLETTVLPFFDKIQTLQQVNDEILEKYEPREWTKYISGETMFKALIILKLCNNEVKYQEASQSHKQIIANAIQEGHIQYQERYNTLLELLDYLNSGNYLEVIE